MNDKEEKTKQDSQPEQTNITPEPSQDDTFQFLQEKIKERPIDKKRLLRRMMITASMALLFGLIACLTFLLLEPVLNNWLNPEAEPNVVSFPEADEEILPEDMLSEKNTTEESTEQTETMEDDVVSKEEQILNELEELEAMQNGEETGSQDAGESTASLEEEIQTLHLRQYQNFYYDMSRLSQKLRSSMVAVTSVKSDVDWFNNQYESSGQAAGLAIANNGRELLVLTNQTALENVEEIRATFCDGKNAVASIKKSDLSTGLSVIAISLKDISAETQKAVNIATLGVSKDEALLGQPVIALGSLNGYTDSVAYGMITSMGYNVTLPDNEYKLLTTDIYSSTNPTGILVNMDGEVIGIVKNDYNNADTANMLSAIGISELKGMITKLSNNVSIPYVGIYAVDVTADIHNNMGVPEGAYVSDIAMDSPAMINGIQKGDVIVQVGDTEIKTAAEYMTAIRQHVVDDTVSITVQRTSHESFQPMEFSITVIEKEQ